MSSSEALPHAPQTTRQTLQSWWKGFKVRDKREGSKKGLIFGVPLRESIEYANVAISLTDGNGATFIYGYVPVIVAKCGVFLKEKATDVEGIFRLSGSAKRIRDLQVIFDSPDKYGKGLDWEGYTVHDAANILRRYLNQLPEPIIPLEFYERFRQPLVSGATVEEAIITYQALIADLPALNRQLLLYILDLLAVFASKSEVNRMTPENLSAIFQPGLISHPNHEMSPDEYATSQEVLVFLINHQDHFLLGMQGADDGHAGMDAKPPVSPVNNPKKGLLQVPTASISPAAEDVRKFGGVRRNASVSSRKGPTGKISINTGIGRSNTLPSRRRAPSPIHIAPISTAAKQVSRTPSNPGQMMEQMATPVEATGGGMTHHREEQRRQPAFGQSSPRKDNSSSGFTRQQSVDTPSRERPFSSLFSAMNSSHRESGDSLPSFRSASNKLKKKRLPGSSNPSAESSSVSLGSPNGAHTYHPHPQPPTSAPHSGYPETMAHHKQHSELMSASHTSVAYSNNNTSTTGSSNHLVPTMSPTPSSTASSVSETPDPALSKARTKKKWRLSNPLEKKPTPSGLISPPFSPRSGSPDREGMLGKQPSMKERRERVGSDSGTEGERKGLRNWLRSKRDRNREQDGSDDGRPQSQPFNSSNEGPLMDPLIEDATLTQKDFDQEDRPGQLATIESGGSSGTIPAHPTTSPEPNTAMNSNRFASTKSV
ncbi:RhoGAP-domain-containing protein [Ascobolus immersus RN42]|uniref:RhoGAP-domain-containing protein n=1 Tax=Ascobolus immersus RN42 TaxID=1160509 RepID=A0A3N4IEC2_ASCIM|nr:RhoGAP-domain-containing protein [Ascobolus immersus RN42]